MSCDADNLLGCFTELEIAAGVPSLVYGRSSGYLDEEESHGEQEMARSSAIDRNKESEAIRMLAGLEDKSAMREVLYRKVLSDSVDYMIMRYAKKEDLPAQYIKIVKEENCLGILIRGFLKRVAGLPLDTRLVGEIDNLILTIKENSSREIVYDRVGRIQSFIHGKVNAAQGFGAHIKLPAMHMRNLLSACRLNLNIEEINGRDGGYLLDIAVKSIGAAERESVSPLKLMRLPVKNYIPYWRVRHMKGLSHYAEIRTRGVLSALMMVSDALPFDEFLKGLINAYSRRN